MRHRPRVVVHAQSVAEPGKPRRVEVAGESYELLPFTPGWRGSIGGSTPPEAALQAPSRGPAYRFRKRSFTCDQLDGFLSPAPQLAVPPCHVARLPGVLPEPGRPIVSSLLRDRVTCVSGSGSEYCAITMRSNVTHTGISQPAQAPAPLVRWWLITNLNAA